MGQKDKVEKLLEDYPDVFADIINVLIYNGKQIIKPQELSETKVRSQYKAADNTLHEQERDILKVWKKGEDYKIIFGIENQTSADKTIENHKPIKHVDEMLKFMQIFAEDERFLQLNVKKDEKGEITMCTILDAAITQGEILKLIMQVQKKIKKGKTMPRIADDLEEDEITILPIYKIAKEYPNDTEKDIYRKLNEK